VISKHECTQGMINEETIRCQLLYELQGTIYLHSDVKAYLNDVTVKEVGKDRYVFCLLEGRELMILTMHT